mgnify:CR=1 FL=1
MAPVRDQIVALHFCRDAFGGHAHVERARQIDHRPHDHFGIGGLQNVASANGTTIYYTIPSYLSACDLMTFGMACTPYAQSVVTGTYPVYVTNSNGASSILYFTVQL